MTRIYGKIYGLVAVMATAGLLFATEPGAISDSPIVSDVNGGVTYSTGLDGAITINFDEQPSIPCFVAATVVARTMGGGANVFEGDYVAGGIHGVTFKIKSETDIVKPVGAMLVLKGESGRLWRNETVSVRNEKDIAVLNSIGLTLAAGWTRDGGGDKQAMWDEDLRNVSAIGVRLDQNGREAKSYTISEFRLEGEGFAVGNAQLTPLERALLDTFGVSSIDQLTEEQLLQDSDGDGMPDVVVILVEHDPSFADSIFMAEPVLADENGVLIKWPCVKGWVYSVYRSSNLLESFVQLPGAAGLQCYQTGYMTYLDPTATGEGPYYYKIRCDRN